jgi:hypothetical protein
MVSFYEPWSRNKQNESLSLYIEAYTATQPVSQAQSQCRTMSLMSLV